MMKPLRKPRSRPASEQPFLGETLDLLRLLWSVYHGLQNVSKQMKRTIGLTGGERVSIRLIGRFPGLSAGELADLLHVHPSTLTGLLNSLERRRLIHRDIDKRDRRRVRLQLTRQGSEYDREMHGTIESAVKTALRTHAPAEAHTARQLLISVAAALHGQKKARRPRRGR